MKKSVKSFRFGILALSCMIAIVLAFPVHAVDTTCKTKYPFILAHGMGYTPSTSHPNSFPGIVEALRACGATVYTPTVPAIASTRNKATQFKAAFLSIKAADGSAKFNIIGHSHGGLYTRDAITNLGLSPYVASLTTVDSPHRGTQIADVGNLIFTVAPWLANMLAGLTPLLNDPAALTSNLHDLSVSYMTNTFNPNTPNISGVYYQSFSGVLKTYDLFTTTAAFLAMLRTITQGDIIVMMYYAMPMSATELFILGGGYNDGMVSADSAKWGTYLGTQTGYWYTTGVNHLDMVNFAPSGAKWDAITYWKNLAKNLKAKGY